ncbi:MAG TPA: hypothetical protein VIV11_24395 [Kofleriaceae bacterium]
MKHDIVLASVVAVLTACDIGEVGFDDDDGVETLGYVNNDLLKRVVLGRGYQKNDWTLPQAGTTPGERVAYICAAYTQLNPTYVSGLLRLDDDAPLTADQIAVFKGVRACVPNAKFDVVLNAEHYADNKRHATGAQALAALKTRAMEIKALLGAEIIFFDFFNSPYNGSDAHKDWYKDRLTEGVRYIRKTLNMRVGGNVWGLEVPPGSDFVALDNFDRENVDGFEYIKKQIATFPAALPVLVHIENNPQKAGSKGLMWINGDADYRRSVIAKYAGEQQRLGYSYMMPVFFPLQCCAGGRCGPDTCQTSPSDRIAYDAARDGNLLQKMNEGLAE